MGIYFYENGDKYEGEWSINLKHANDNFTYVISWDIYIGQWKDGERSGFGKLVFRGIYEGDTFEGQFKDNLISGEGIYLYNSRSFIGDKYKGQWKGGLKSGNGTYFWKNGAKYVGMWKNNKRNGYGVKYTSNGDIEEQGQWKDSVFIGN